MYNVDRFDIRSIVDSVQEKKIASFRISNVDFEQAVQASLRDFFVA